MTALDQAKLTIAARVIAVQGQALRQYALREELRERQMRILTMIRDHPQVASQIAIIALFGLYLLADYLHRSSIRKAKACAKSQRS